MDYLNCKELPAFRDLEQIPGKGGFLLSGDPVNCMTIGYLLTGFVWYRPMCVVFVRKTRYTYETMKNGVFTVSIPKLHTMNEALSLCGKESGKNMNKMEAAGLQQLPAVKNGIGGIMGCETHFECTTVFQADSDLSFMRQDILRKHYDPNREGLPNGNPHTIYFGEILATYRE